MSCCTNQSKEGVNAFLTCSVFTVSFRMKIYPLHTVKRKIRLCITVIRRGTRRINRISSTCSPRTANCRCTSYQPVGISHSVRPQLICPVLGVQLDKSVATSCVLVCLAQWRTVHGCPPSCCTRRVAKRRRNWSVDVGDGRGMSINAARRAVKKLSPRKKPRRQRASVLPNRPLILSKRYTVHSILDAIFN